MKSKHIPIFILIFLIIILIINILINKYFSKENFTSVNNKKNLVFTSAGNNSNFDKLWLDKHRNYDVWVVYYGNDYKIYNNYKSKVDFIEKRKGSKFQNFDYIYKKYRNKIDMYDRFFILDDDIIINTSEINEMFKISKKYDLWLCAPTFKTDGSSKISWPITKTKENSYLRYTNFVEVNTPLFNKFSLDKLMEKYDNKLIGWGIDYLYSWILINDKLFDKKKIALIDKIQCVNPHDKVKNGRELKKINNSDKRAQIWNTYKNKNNIEKITPIVYSQIDDYNRL